MLLHGQFWVKDETKVPGRIREGDVVRAKSKVESGRGTVEGFKEDEKGKRRASVLSSFNLSWFSVIHVFMLSVHALSSLVRLVTSLRGVDFWSCVSSAKSWWFTEWLAMISERGVVYRTKRMGPSTEPWGTPYMSCDGDEDELLTEVDWYLSERCEWNHWNAAIDWMPKNRAQAGEENLVVNSVKSGRKIQQKKNRNVVIVQSGNWEYRLQYVTKRSQCCILLDRLTERDCWGCFLGDGREICGERLKFFRNFGQKR